VKSTLTLFTALLLVPLAALNAADEPTADPLMRRISPIFDARTQLDLTVA
jgi:hypothetical protein